MDNTGIPIYCPACMNTECVIYTDLGDEEDADGVFGNHRIECTVCGRKTCDMDTFEDAVEAWNERGDVVHFDGADTILINMSDIQRLIEEGKPVDRKTLRDMDLRDRTNIGY